MRAEAEAEQARVAGLLAQEGRYEPGALRVAGKRSGETERAFDEGYLAAVEWMLGRLGDAEDAEQHR